MVITLSRFHCKITDNKIYFDLAEGLKETSSTYFTKTEKEKWDQKAKMQKFSLKNSDQEAFFCTCLIRRIKAGQTCIHILVVDVDVVHIKSFSLKTNYFTFFFNKWRHSKATHSRLPRVKRLWFFCFVKWHSCLNLCQCFEYDLAPKGITWINSLYFCQNKKERNLIWF